MENTATHDENHKFESVINFFSEINEELKTNSSFSNINLDKLVDSLIGESSNLKVVDADTVFYRARRYTKTDAENRFRNPPNELFQGYNAAESFVNLNATSAGRCNREGVICLYVAEGLPCCMYEIKANQGDIISLSEIKVIRELRILNLSKHLTMSRYAPSILKGIPDSLLYIYLIELFQKKYEKDGDYLVMQYLAERLRENNYDGISFYSSLYDGDKRINYPIFNYEKCASINSRLYKILRIAKGTLLLELRL